MRRLLLSFCVVATACSPIRGCVESRFDLAPDSRLPKWFSTQSPRGLFSAELVYYTGGNAVIKLFRSGSKVAEVAGQSCWHPRTIAERDANNGSYVGIHPTYHYISVSDQIEVIEHPGGSVFRVVDDPLLLKAAIEAKTCHNGS